MRHARADLATNTSIATAQRDRSADRPEDRPGQLKKRRKGNLVHLAAILARYSGDERGCSARLYVKVGNMAQSVGSVCFPGEVRCRDASERAVEVCDVSCSECRISPADAGLVKGEQLALWIGAIGPLRATVASDDDHALVFNGAIHPAIVEHFAQMG